MVNLKRILCGVVCCVMLLSSLSLGSCGNNGDDGKDTNNGISGDAVSTDVPSALPENLNFEEADVNILIRDAYKTEFISENTGAVIDSAINRRNLIIEEKLGVKLNFIPQVADTDNRDTNYLQGVKNMYLGGITPADGGYHIVTSHCTYGATLAAEGVNYNLRSDVEENYHDLTKPWHNQSFVESNTLGNVLYYSVGDANISAIDRSLVTYVNKTEADNNGLGNIDFIEVVNNNEWTLEYLKNLTKNIYVDKEGEGDRDEKDYYGLGIIKGSGNMDGILLGMGMRFSRHTSDGGLELCINSQRNEEIYSKLYDFYFNEVLGVRVYLPTFETSHDE